MRHTLRNRATRGFTIVELLITLVIASLLLAAAYQFFTRQQKGYATQDEVSRLQAQARNAQDFLVRAIQQAGAYSPDGSGKTISLRGQVVLSAGDHYLTIQYDDPYRTNDPGVITEEEVVTFLVSSEPPNAASGANEWLSDDPAGGTTTVGMWFDQDRADGVEADEKFDVTVPMTLKGPPYTLYRITPDKDSPTDVAKLHAEPIATGVDNLVFRYFDQNGAPIPRDAVTGAAGAMPYVLTPAQRSLVRSVEVEVAVRAGSSDKTYFANPAVPAFSVATYDAAGAARAGADLFKDDGYRRRVFRTRITPRNLSVNNCGSLTLYADDAQPRCPASTTIRATVQNRFGQPVQGVEVLFNADAGAFSDPSPTTDVNGEAVTELQYTGTARTISVSASAIIDCSPVGPDKYTLVSAIPVNFVAGDSAEVEAAAAASPAPTQIDTCGADASWQVTFTTFDACGNPVMPLPGLMIQAVDATAALFGRVDNVAEVELTASPQTVELRPPTTGPYTSPPDVDGAFTQMPGRKLPAPAWFSGWKSAVPSVKVRPWPPNEIVDWSNTIAPFAFDDCSLVSKADVFRVLDCHGNPIYRLPGAPVTATITSDGVGPADQGKLTSTNNGAPGIWADTDPATAAGSTLQIVENAGAPWYNLTYTTPAPCGLSPQTGMPAQMNPKIKLELPADLIPAKAADPAERTLTVRRCAGCDLVANPAVMTECGAQTTITVSGCQLNGQTVELEVTSDTGLNGSFRQGAAVPTKVLTLAGNSPSTASTTLYLGKATDGTNLTVRAYYPSKAAARWQCDPLLVKVSSLCQKLRIYADAGYSQLVSNAPGSQDCLAKIQNFYFEVDDCQDAPGTLRKAVTVYAVAQNGAWLDKEQVDLVSHRVSGHGTPTTWRSLRNLMLVQSPTFHADNDGALQFPPGRAVQFIAQYRDPNDGSDPPLNKVVNLTAPVTIPVALPVHDCLQSVTMAVPLPICFPNAITSGGGGQWNGNYQVHWGDVVIRGEADTSSDPKRIKKDSGATLDGSSYGGAGNSDRFFDIYVGKRADGSGGNLTGVATTDLQPYQALGYGNYFQYLSYDKITEMMAELDYDIMKELAKERGVYWYTLASGLIRNPATDKEGSLEQVLHMPTPGVTNAYGHDGKYIFVDTFGAADPGPATTSNDVKDPAKLPSFALNGIYTEGIIFVTASVEYKSGGNGRDITISSPPEFESRYDHNTVAYTEDDLPIRPNPNAIQQTVGLSDINVNGGVYVKGSVLFSGSPKIFGAISAEHGFLGNGTPEIWYNYNLNVSEANEALCVFCCELSVNPASSILTVGSTRALTATGAAGAVQWASEDDAIATVSSTGVVTARAPGTTRIKAVDQNNCADWVTITVQPPCAGFAIAPNVATVGWNGAQFFTASPVPAGSNITWSLSNPAVATLAGAGGAATATGGLVANATTITVNTHDTAGICPDDSAFLTVNPPVCGLSVAPAAVTVTIGATTSLSAVGAHGAVTWNASNGNATLLAAAGSPVSVRGDALGSTVLTATDGFFAPGSCRATATVTVACPTITVAGANTVRLGRSIVLTASGGASPYTWASSKTNNADFSSTTATTGTLLGKKKNQTTDIMATDANGCVSAAFTVSITP